MTISTIDESQRKAARVAGFAYLFIEGELRRPTSARRLFEITGSVAGGRPNSGRKEFRYCGVTVAELVSKCDGVRHSANWHYNANDSKPKKGNSDTAAGRRDATFRGLFPAPCGPCTAGHVVRLRRRFLQHRR